MQTLRGIACLLLVGFHAVGSSAASGLHVPDDSSYRAFTNLFVHVRMPLFTFLSGFVYALRPLGEGQAWTFSARKLQRLGIPLLVATTVLYCLHRGLDHRGPPLSELWTIYLFPYGHLWFVQALLLLFGGLIGLESVGALSTFSGFLTVFAGSIALYFAGPFDGTNLLGLHNATYLLPFFLWGLAAHRFRAVLQSGSALLATGVCFLVAQSWHGYIVLTSAPAPIDPVAQRSSWNLFIGMSASLFALQRLPRLRLMETVGGSSYAIYLYHPVFVAAVLLVATRVETPLSVTLALGVAAGVAGPMLLEWAARRVPAGQLLLEGRIAPTERGADGGRMGRRPALTLSTVEPANIPRRASVESKG